MSKKSYDELEASSYLAGSNTPYIEELYDQYLQNPASLSQEWQNFFNQLSTLDNGKKKVKIGVDKI